jgi:hypothetical protein
MRMLERFWIGVYLAAGSFWLLWLYKKLLIYLSCAAVIFFCMQVFLYNLPLLGFAGDEFSLLIALQGLHYQITISGWFYQIALVVGSFFYVFMLTFFHIGLIRHTLALVLGNSSLRVSTVMMDTVQWWRTILNWALLFTALHLMMRFVMASGCCLHPFLVHVGTVLIYILMAGWSLLTFLVLPVIAIERQGVWHAIKRSQKLVSAVIIEIIGAQCWIMILCLLAIMPLIMLMKAVGSQTSVNVLFVIMTWLVVFASYIVLSAQTVIRTLMYQRSMQLTSR